MFQAKNSPSHQLPNFGKNPHQAVLAALFAAGIFVWLEPLATVGWAEQPPSRKPSPLPQERTQLTYQGVVAQVDRQGRPGPPEKSFTLTLVTADREKLSADLYWVISEKGSKQWPWPERFGTWKATANTGKNRFTGAGSLPTSDLGPTVLFDYGTGAATIEIPSTFFQADRETIKQGARWSDRRFSYEVLSKKELGKRSCWQIQLSDAYGPRQRVFWDPADGRLVGLDVRVFLNMGTEYQLQLRLSHARRLPEKDHSALSSELAALVSLQQALSRPARRQQTDWSGSQLQALSDQWAKIQPTISSELLLPLAEAISGDLRSQTAVAQSIQALTAKLHGRTLPQFSLSTLDEAKVSQDHLAGKVVVLHFWEYRGDPLEEPYGQVGYLDFLFRRRRAQGVEVYGVAVNSDFGAAQRKGPALRSVKKLAEFMNLSYPIVLDDGALLRQLGDPRRAGANLPLVLVVGRDGQVRHAHVGFYPVDRRQGLVELDRQVIAAIKGNRTRSPTNQLKNNQAQSKTTKNR